MTFVDLEPAAQQMADLIKKINDDSLGAPHTVPGYALGDLIDHIDRLVVAFTAAAAKAGGESGSPRWVTRRGSRTAGGRGGPAVRSWLWRRSCSTAGMWPRPADKLRLRSVIT